MKELKMTCDKCGKFTRILGEDSTEILEKLDKSGWQDKPDECKGVTFTCPDCQE